MSPASSARAERRVDVAVVGAGLAGLVAARDVARGGRTAVVLEARDRVGGRLLNHRLASGAEIELGGEYIGHTQDRIAALARETGVGTFKTYNEGDNVQYFGGVRGTYPATGLPTQPDVASDIVRALEIDSLARTVPVDEPWRAPRAAEWDSQTLETWKRETFRTAAGRAAFDSAGQSIWGAQPGDLSLLFALAYVARAGNEHTPGSIIPLISTGGGAQELRFRGGSQLIAQRLARRLGRRRVALGTPVRRIVRRRGGGVLVESDHTRVRARRVIVAIPPALTADIDYAPALPARRDQLVQRTPQGSLIKCECVYERPFWREQGLSGQAVSDTGPATTTFDNSPPGGRPGVLFGFVGGAEARRWGPRPQRERRRAVIDNLVTYFGERARHPVHYVEHDWSKDEWTRGCPTAILPPGVLATYGPAIARPVGAIHWAGTETAGYWSGYMDGAVRSGERAAGEVLSALRAS